MKTKNYERYYLAGIIITAIIFVALIGAWWMEPARMELQSEEIHLESVTRGRSIYSEQCSLCHGDKGEGGAGPALNSKNLLLAATDQIMFETISAGRPDTIMPAWAQINGGPLTIEGIWDLVHFMRLWEENAPDLSGQEFVPDASRGMAIYINSCIVCHDDNGSGSNDAPAINRQSSLNSHDNEWYRGVITYGRPTKGMPTWGAILSPNQVEDMIALMEAWRNGETVLAEVAVSDMLNSAVFELSQGQIDDAIFFLDRAVEIAFGPILDDFSMVRDSLDSSKLDLAFDQLVKLSEDWPIGISVDGEVVYLEYCSKCHGEEGGGGVGSRLIENEFISTKTNSELLMFILTGRSGTAMGGFEGRLTEVQIANAIALLRDLQLND